jgi:HrpA-like RNA helicase
MEDIGIENIESFDFIDPPDREAFHEAYETLIALGAIDRNGRKLTSMGRRMAGLPLEPRLARMLLEAEKYECVEAVATVAAFLSLPHGVFNRPRDKQFEADMAHRQFKDPRSDALTCLRIWKHYVQAGYSRSWCYQNFLNLRSLSEIERVRQQLLSVLERSGIEISQSDDEETIMRSVVAGLIYNLFEHDSRHGYKGVFRNGDFQDVYIHPGSSLFSGLQNTRWFVATEIVRTTKLFARNCTGVRLEWLQEIAPQLFTYGTADIEPFGPGDKKVTVRQQVRFRGVLAGTISREVSLTEARRLQDEKIREAEAQNWKKLTFWKTQDYLLGEILVSEDDRYRMFGSYGHEEGVPYYCRVTIFEGRRWHAHPEFRVFDLREHDEKVSVAEAVKELTLTFGGSAINMGKLRK